MKIYTLLLLSLLALSCKKSGSASPSTSTVSNGNFIQNWHTNDTLIGTLIDSAGGFVGYDTIFTREVGDTSCIVYHGKQYYIWKIPIIATDTFKSNQSQYVNCCINDKLFDTTNAASFTWLNTARPYKYKDNKGDWNYQLQALLLDKGIVFKKVVADTYTSYTQYY